MFLFTSVCKAVWYRQGIGPRAQAQRVINLTSWLTKHQNQIKNSQNVLNWTWILRPATLTVFDILIPNDKLRVKKCPAQMYKDVPSILWRILGRQRQLWWCNTAIVWLVKSWWNHLYVSVDILATAGRQLYVCHRWLAGVGGRHCSWHNPTMFKAEIHTSCGITNSQNDNKTDNRSSH